MAKEEGHVTVAEESNLAAYQDYRICLMMMILPASDSILESKSNRT